MEYNFLFFFLFFNVENWTDKCYMNQDHLMFFIKISIFDV